MDEQGEVRGGGRVQRGHREVRVDAVGQGVEPVGRHHRLLGGRALPPLVPEAVAPHAVTGPEAGHAGSRPGDRTDQVTADDEREVNGRTEHPRPDVGVHRVHGGGEHVHQDVGRAGARRGQLAVPDDVRGTQLLDVRGTHGIPCCHRGPERARAPSRTPSPAPFTPPLFLTDRFRQL